MIEQLKYVFSLHKNGHSNLYFKLLRNVVINSSLDEDQQTSLLKYCYVCFVKGSKTNYGYKQAIRLVEKAANRLAIQL